MTAFTRTINQVELHNPIAIILPEDPTSSNANDQDAPPELERVLEEEFPVQIIHLERGLWNPDVGESRLIICRQPSHFRCAASEKTNSQR
jgi:hypothetical protein